MTPVDWLDLLFNRIADGGPAAPALGLAVGVILSFTPVALPAMPAVAAIAATAPHSDSRPSRRLLRGWVVTGAFVLGMDAPLAIAGYLVAEIAILVIQASVITNVAGAVVLAAVGLRLLLRRPQTCRPRDPVPPDPVGAFGYGVAFSVTGCAGCAPLLIALGGAAAYTGGPLGAAATLLAFLTGRTTVLFTATALTGRLLAHPKGTRTFDLLVGCALLAAAAYYTYRVATGQVTGLAPGQPGSNTLP